MRIVQECALFLVEEEERLIQAMKRLDESAKKVLFVTRQGRFVATLTDGDIRRWILKNGDLDATVRQMANYHPHSIGKEEVRRARTLFRQYGIAAVPVLDGDGRVTAICMSDEIAPLQAMLLPDVPVVIMAGGKGTRLYPYTKILPKPLIPIGELPISELIINHFFAQGCKRFFMILNYKKNMIRAYFNETEKEYSLEMIDEPIALGTGGGLSLLRGIVKETFIFTNCDTLITEELGKAYQLHKEQGNSITMVCSMKNYIIPYGVIHLDDQGCISDMQEKPQLPFLINTGTYFVEPEVLELISSEQSISFPEMIQQCMKDGGKVSIYPVSEDHWLDMGQMNEMDHMKRRLGIDEQ